MTSIPNWTEALTLRPEVIASDGGVGELQMSLHKAVYQTVDVPYREVNYYSDITQPTPNLIGFFSRIARRSGWRRRINSSLSPRSGHGRRQVARSGRPLPHGERAREILRHAGREAGPRRS